MLPIDIQDIQIHYLKMDKDKYSTYLYPIWKRIKIGTVLFNLL
jgi:hypothetical protein